MKKQIIKVILLFEYCNTCAWSCCSTVCYWLGPPGRTSRITSKYSGAEGLNVVIPRFVA